jgi:hypothetical protein
MIVPGTFAAFQVFEEIRVENGRADLIDAHGPFAEVDAAAAVGAEGKIFVRDFDQLFAAWAMKRFDFLCGGLWHSGLFYFLKVLGIGKVRRVRVGSVSVKGNRNGNDIAGKGYPTLLKSRVGWGTAL